MVVNFRVRWISRSAVQTDLVDLEHVWERGANRIPKKF